MCVEKIIKMLYLITQVFVENLRNFFKMLIFVTLFLLTRINIQNSQKGEVYTKESYKMSKRMKITLLLTLVGCLLMGNLSVFAAENAFIELPQDEVEVISEANGSIVVLSEPTLLACNVGIGIADNGLLITFDTNASHTADEIGVKNVVLQEKTWYGWKDMPVSNYCKYNSYFYSGDIVYTLATKGTTYRVKCTHYAKYGSTELTLNNTSSELVYN